MSTIEHITPLHDRILVRRLTKKNERVIWVREHPEMIDMVGQGENAQHDDNRRVFIMSRVLAIGSAVRDIAKGDTIVHTAWNDLPSWLDVPADYCFIRENDVAGHCDPEGMGYDA